MFPRLRDPQGNVKLIGLYQTDYYESASRLFARKAMLYSNLVFRSRGC